VQLPGLSGVDLQRVLIAEGNRTPMIFITAYFDERSRQSVMEAGAIGYLSKSFDDESLIELLQSALRSKWRFGDCSRDRLSATGPWRQLAEPNLAAVVESSDDAIIGKDLNSTITTWNKAAERLFGYLANEVVGKSITILIPPGRLNEEVEILERIRHGEVVDHFETVRRCKDGRLVVISLTVSPVTDDSGKIIGASKIARDITERMRDLK
jgi:PAS domain S-box-containing protein